MRRLVQDAGPGWCAGRFGTWHRLTGATSGTTTVGSRSLAWRRTGTGAVEVTHPDTAGAPVSYPVATATTVAPNSAERLWWSCPGCARRVGLLYLPGDRDRLACRVCCGLGYASQYPGVRRGPILSAPVFTEEVTIMCRNFGGPSRFSRRVWTFPARASGWGKVAETGDRRCRNARALAAWLAPSK
jgi:hypothetical protein